MSDSRDRRRKPQSGKSSSKGRGGSSVGRGGNKGSGKGGASSKSGSGGGRTSRRGGDRYAKSGERTGSKTRGSDTGSSKDRQSRESGDRGRSGTYDKEPRKLPAGAEGLPRHVVESLMRVTPAARQNAALAALAAAAEAFSEGQYHSAVKKAEHAKDLASRDATIREILGLASYRVGDWHTALRELRTYRRLSGETTHMPVEMDVLRAMGRSEDVTAVWQEFKKHGGGPAVKKEARVVYASHLIDVGDLEEAREIAGSPKKVAEPWPEDMRLWYVAARIAALSGDKDEARRIASSIVLEDPSFPGLDELDRLIEAG